MTVSVLGAFRQTPAERKRYVLDYSQWLDCDSNETLSTCVFSYETPTTTPVVLDGAISASFKSITLYVEGGDATNQYRIIATVTTSEGQTKQDEFLINVVALP